MEDDATDGKEKKNEEDPTSNTNSTVSELVGGDPSTVVIVNPRVLQSEVGLEATDEQVDRSEQVEKFVVAVDDDGKSVVDLRVSRGKSVVNRTEPSKIHRRSGPPPPLPETSQSPHSPPIVLRLRPGRLVTFKSSMVVTSEESRRNIEQQQQQNHNTIPDPIITPATPEEDMISPNQSPQLVMAPQQEKSTVAGHLRSEYDFYKAGQTLQKVQDKLERVKNRMVSLKEILQQKRVAFNLTSASLKSQFKKCDPLTFSSPVNKENPRTSQFNQNPSPSLPTKTITTKTANAEVTSNNSRMVSKDPKILSEVRTAAAVDHEHDDDGIGQSSSKKLP